MSAGLLLLTSVGAAQAQSFTPPAGCETYLTVQMKSCQVEHHYTCEGSSDRWREVYTADGVYFQSRIDAEAQWLSSMDLPEGAETVTLTPLRDAISVSNLLETGVDAFDFEQRLPDGTVERVVGEDRIVERNVLVAGERLHRTVFEVTYLRPDGTEIGHFSGAEYVSDVHHRFFAGRGTGQFDGATDSYDHRPMAFVYPGQPGFGRLEPMFDCGVMMSALDAR